MRNWFGNGRVAWRAVVVALLAQGLASAAWAQARIESLSGSVQPVSSGGGITSP